MWVELGGQGQVDFSGAFTAPHTKYGHKASHPSGQEGGSRGTDRCLKSRSARTGPHVAPRGPRPPALGPPPEAPSSSRAASVGSAGLLSARLLCVAVGGAGAGPHEGCYEGPRQKDRWRHGRGDQGWRSRGSSQAKTLCPAGEGSPSCLPEHPEGPSPCRAGSLSGHTVGGEPPTYEQKGGAFSG